jgi:hypothetical protein
MTDALRVKVFRAQSHRADFEDRARRLAGVLLGRQVASLPQESVAGEDERLVWTDIGETSGVDLVYRPMRDDLAVRNVAVESDYRRLLGAPRLSEDEARSVFFSVLDQLEGAGLVQTSSLDLDNVRVGTVEHGGGVSGEPMQEPEILGYKFNVKRKLGGMQLRNSLVRVAVMRGLQVGSIRVVEGAVELAEDGEVTRAVDDSECSSRFHREFPNAVIKQQGVGYFLPADRTTTSVIEPQCYFSFVQEFIVEGQTSITRRKDVRYSVLNKDAEPELIGAPSAGNAE